MREKRIFIVFSIRLNHKVEINIQSVSLAHLAHSYLFTMTHNKIVSSEKSTTMKVSRSGETSEE